ncbi:hypothetical protein [Algoriphagus marincola]|uniref:hypothetical protein n=1 Tax=Algoriphagus marincola TaxID=264027 RepID=UPI00040892C0|nr:hypothetical protein [Algoriphagus marincola]
MKILKKIKPHKVDLLVFGLEKGDSNYSPTVKELEFQLSFDSKNHSYKIKEHGEIIHRSNIYFNSHLLRAFDFDQPMITIGDCVTIDAYKGQGIYPWVITEIVKEHLLKSHIYMLVSPQNIPSIKGIQKAGLRKLARIRCLKIGPVYLGKKLELFD